MRSLLRRAAVLTALLGAALAAASPASAQWVTIGRKALGKIQTMTQKESTGTPGYSVATVVLPGSVDKVYAKALKTAQESPRVKLTHQDPKQATLEVADGKQVVGLRIARVDGKLVQVLIASTVAPGAEDPVPAAVAATLRVCKEVGVACEVVK